MATNEVQNPDILLMKIIHMVLHGGVVSAGTEEAFLAVCLQPDRLCAHSIKYCLRAYSEADNLSLILTSLVLRTSSLVQLCCILSTLFLKWAQGLFFGNRYKSGLHVGERVC